MTQEITGYRNLSPEEVAKVNEIKALAEQVGNVVEGMKTAIALPGGMEPDERWVAIGEMQLQQGFMALVRSITRPTTF